MKSLRMVLLAGFSALALSASAAGRPGSMAAGIQVGSVTGLDLKLWLNQANALDFGLGSGRGDSLLVQGSYLWHRYHVFHSEREDLQNNMPLYFGVGGLLGLEGSGTGRTVGGLRGVFGVTYIFPEEPFDAFLEVSPTLFLSPSNTFAILAGLGGRYYFR